MVCRPMDVLSDLPDGLSVLTIDQEVRGELTSILRSFLYRLKVQPDMETRTFRTFHSIRHKPIRQYVSVHRQCSR